MDQRNERKQRYPRSVQSVSCLFSTTPTEPTPAGSITIGDHKGPYVRTSKVYVVIQNYLGHISDFRVGGITIRRDPLGACAGRGLEGAETSERREAGRSERFDSGER